MQQCISAAAVQGWVTLNWFNPDKTKFLPIGAPAKRDALAHFFPLISLVQWCLHATRQRTLVFCLMQTSLSLTTSLPFAELVILT